jgi:hypothetical protein
MRRGPSLFRKARQRRELVQAITAAILSTPEFQKSFKEVEDEKYFVDRIRQEIEKHPRVLTTS